MMLLSVTAFGSTSVTNPGRVSTSSHELMRAHPLSVFSRIIRRRGTRLWCFASIDRGARYVFTRLAEDLTLRCDALFWLRLLEGVPAMREVGITSAFAAVQQTFDGEDLDAWEIRADRGRGVEALLHRFHFHRLAGFGQRDEQADLRLLARHYVREVAYHRDVDVFTALHRHHDLLGRTLVVLEKDQSVDAAVRAFLLALKRLRVHQRTRPPLELVF